MAGQISYIGETTGNVDLDETVFGEAFHEPLVHRAVMAELNAKRQGTSSTLTRGEVSMTGAKAWRQKGTGRARVGALSAPHRTGGGVTFGPKPRHYTVKINRKERRRALRSALSVHADRGSLAALDASAFQTPSTKKAAEALSGFGDGGRALVLLTEDEASVALSFRNIESVKVLSVQAAGVADVIGAARLVASPAAIEAITRVAAAPVKEPSA
ncbi:MAG: 50S ribosomal protein L4 [Thermoleophilaceae bacterium]